MLIMRVRSFALFKTLYIDIGVECVTKRVEKRTATDPQMTPLAFPKVGP